MSLPILWENKISQIIYEHRMHYELHLESAVNFEQLIDKLKNKGFLNLPMGASCILKIDGYCKAPIVDTSKITSTKIMM